MKYISLFILSVLFIQLSLQQNPAPFFINYTLDRLADGDTFTLGSGPQVLTVTPQGEFGEGWQDLTLNLERTQVNNAAGEWIYEWETLNGEVFSLTDDNGHLVVVGDDGYREDLTYAVASESGLPVEAVPAVVGILFTSVSNDVYVLDTEINSISAAEAYYLGLTGAQVVVEGNVENEN